MGGLRFIGVLALIAVTLFMFAKFGGSNQSDNSNGLTKVQGFSHAHGIAVDVKSSSRVYIATHNGLFVLINDEGLYRVGGSQNDYMGFSVHPTDPNVFFASGHPRLGGNLGYQKSEDGGQTWQKVSDGLNGPADFHALAVGQANPDIIYGYYKGLQRSRDGGIGWKKIDVNLPGIIQLATNTEEEGTVYAATSEGMYVSSDFGESWEALPGLNNNAVFAVAIKPGSNQEMIVYTQFRGLIRSSDGGQTWQTITDIATNKPILYLAYAKTEPNIVYAINQDNNIFKSTDSGQNWNKVH